MGNSRAQNLFLARAYLPVCMRAPSHAAPSHKPIASQPRALRTRHIHRPTVSLIDFGAILSPSLYIVVTNGLLRRHGGAMDLKWPASPSGQRARGHLCHDVAPAVTRAAAHQPGQHCLRGPRQQARGDIYRCYPFTGAYILDRPGQAHCRRAHAEVAVSALTSGKSRGWMHIWPSMASTSRLLRCIRGPDDS